MTKAEEVYLAIRRKILDRTISPDTRFRVVAVAKHYAASPVLAADGILRLFRDGYVRPAPGTGYQSIGFGRDDVLETYNFRLMVEPRAAAVAAVQPNPELLAELEYQLVEMTEALASDPIDIDRYLVGLSYFDTEMVLGSGNGVLRDRCGSVLTAALFRFTVFAFDRAAMDRALDLRRLIFEAVNRSDGEYAASVTQVALHHAKHALLKSPAILEPPYCEDWMTAPEVPDGEIAFGQGEPDIEPLVRTWLQKRERRKHN